MLPALGAELAVLQLGGGLLVDAGLVVLHLAFLTREIDIGIFSSRHVRSGYSSGQIAYALY
jgi:hypothetical protein